MHFHERNCLLKKSKLEYHRQCAGSRKQWPPSMFFEPIRPGSNNADGGDLDLYSPY